MSESKLATKVSTAAQQTENYSQVVEELRTMWNKQADNMIRARWVTGQRAAMILGIRRDKNGAIVEDPEGSTWKYGARSVENIAEALGHGFDYNKLQRCIRFFKLVPEKTLDAMISARNARNSPVFTWKPICSLLALPGPDVQLQVIEQAIHQAAKMTTSLSKFVERAKEKHGRTKGSSGQVKRHRSGLAGGTRFNDMITNLTKNVDMATSVLAEFKKLDKTEQRAEYDKAKTLLSDISKNIEQALKNLTGLRTRLNAVLRPTK